MTRARYCPSCRGEREFDQPPCLDGHDACPEWACVDCGHAVFCGWYADDATPVPAAGPATARPASAA